MFSYEKIATINILPIREKNSILLDDFLIKKILIGAVKSADLPWRYGSHLITLEKLIGQCLLCKLDDGSIVLMKILEGSENNIKFKWVFRKDGIMDFSQLNFR